MKTIVVLCLLALTFAAPATKKRDIQRVFAQVESALATNGPLDIVANVLGEFTNDATAEQSAFDELRARATRECALESEYRTRQVNEAESARKSAQTALDSYNDQKNRAVADLSFTNKVLGETETMIHILTESRASEVTAFAEYEETYNFNAAQFDEVVELVEAVVSGQASFVQIAKHAQKMLRSAVKSNQGEKIATLMSMLVQVTAGETDNEFLEQLSNVVNRLRGEIDDEWNTVQAQELKDQEEFETFSAAAEAQHATLTATRDYLEGLLAQLNRGIVEETGAVNASTARRDQHQRLLDEATAYCNTNEQLYQTGTQERRDELDLIDNLRAKVTLRWGDFEDIERERVQRERAAGKRF